MLQPNVTLNLAERVNQKVQHDLLFWARYVVANFTDEASRWEMAIVVPDRSVASLLHAIKADWCRIFGPMENLIVDQESALMGDAVGAWCNERGVNRDPCGKDCKTKLGLVERRNALLRAVINRMMSSELRKDLVQAIEKEKGLDEDAEIEGETTAQREISKSENLSRMQFTGSNNREDEAKHVLQFDECVAEANAALNELLNIDGFSPHQLAFG